MKYSITQLKWLVLFCSTLMLIMSSCTITKRVHRKGWHVEWRKTYKHPVDQTNSTPSGEKEEFVVVNQSSEIVVQTAESIESEESLTPIVETESDLYRADIEEIQEESKQADQLDEFQSHTSERNKNTPKSPGDKKVLTGKLLLLLGIILITIFGMPGISDLVRAIVQTLGIVAIITGAILWFKGRRLQEQEGTRDGKSEEAKKYIKIGFILLLIGISIAIGTSILFSVLEPAAASTGNVVTEVVTITGGIIAGYTFAAISIALIVLALIFLIMGWTKD